MEDKEKIKYQMQIKPFERKDGVKYKVIQITDIALHTAKKRLTKSIGKKIKEAFTNKEPGRAYFSMNKEENNNPFINADIINLIQNDPELIKTIREEEEKGFKVLLEVPKEIPMHAGKDTEEFINSKRGKRVVRGLAKNKKSDKI